MQVIKNRDGYIEWIEGDGTCILWQDVTGFYMQGYEDADQGYAGKTKTGWPICFDIRYDSSTNYVIYFPTEAEQEVAYMELVATLGGRHPELERSRA
jgi:hypothetical protein